MYTLKNYQRSVHNDRIINSIMCNAPFFSLYIETQLNIHKE